MMWDRVIEACRATIVADDILGPIYGDRVRMASASATPFVPEVPILEYSVIGDVERDQWAPTIIQFDQWAPDVEVAVASERRLRRIFNPELPQEFAGLFMWAQYVDGTVLATPDRNGFAGRAVRFRFTPLRERHDPA